MRISVIYCISVTFVGLLVSSDGNRLFNGAGVAASQFFITIKDAGIKGLPGLFENCHHSCGGIHRGR